MGKINLFPFKFQPGKGLWLVEPSDDFKLNKSKQLYLPQTFNENARESAETVKIKAALETAKAGYTSIHKTSEDLTASIISLLPTGLFDFGKIPSHILSTDNKTVARRKLEKENKRKELAEQRRKDRLMADPVSIKGVLDKYVIGQEQAKIDLSIAFAEMYQRGKTDSAYQRSNILMLGPTGVGKTKLLETMSKCFNLPMEIIKVGSMVQPGIVGKGMDDVFRELRRKIKRKTEKGDSPEMGLNHLMMAMGGRSEDLSKYHAILYIDEIDKICQNSQHQRNVFSGAIQDELIGLMDKGEISGIDTSKVLFVGGGAFEGLEAIAQLSSKKSIGFGKESELVDSFKPMQITDDNLQAYGMKRELIGRFPIRTVLYPLGKEDLCRILTEAEDSVIKTTSDFYMKTKNVKFNFSEEAIGYIAQVSQLRGTGARALNGIVEQVLKPYKFQIAKYKGKEISIGLDEVRKAV